MEIPDEAGALKSWIADVERKWLTGDETVSRELTSLSAEKKILVMAACGRHYAAQRSAATADAAQRWKKMDPVDLVPKEREKFSKGKIKIFRTPDLKMKISEIPIGAKLAPWLGLQFYEMLEISSSPEDLSRALLPFFSVPRNFFLRGSLRTEAENFALKKLGKLTILEISKIIPTVAAALRKFSPSPALVRFMHCKALPAALHANAGSDVLIDFLHNSSIRLTAAQLKQMLDDCNVVAVSEAMLVGGVCDAEWLMKVAESSLSLSDAIRMESVLRFFGLQNNCLSDRIKNDFQISEELTAENLRILSFDFAEIPPAMKMKNPDVDFDRLSLIGRL